MASYVDGVSLTHGQNVEVVCTYGHFVAGLSEVHNGHSFT